MTYTQVYEVFYVKPLLKKLMSRGLSVIKIGRKLRKDPSTIYSYIRKFWNLSYEEAKRRFF